MAKDTEHFKVSEFTCKCGCGYNVIDQRVIDMAERIRQELGVPVRVNSGCRCEKHNKASGGTRRRNRDTNSGSEYGDIWRASELVTTERVA